MTGPSSVPATCPPGEPEGGARGGGGLSEPIMLFSSIETKLIVRPPQNAAPKVSTRKAEMSSPHKIEHQAVDDEVEEPQGHDQERDAQESSGPV